MKRSALSSLIAITMIMPMGQVWADSNPAVLEEGKTLFISGAVPACAICHTLQDAGTTGAIGPDLDELRPDAERIKKVMIEGMGAMPSFAGTLSEAQLDAITAYVVHATGAGQ